MFVWSACPPTPLSPPPPHPPPPGFHRLRTAEVLSLTSQAVKMLTLWKQCYLDVRAKIEASGRDQRWEFDRKRLFERTDYCAAICEDLNRVAQVDQL